MMRLYTIQRIEEHDLAVNESLRAIATAEKIYSYSLNATAALSIVSHGTLTNAQWFSYSEVAVTTKAIELLDSTCRFRMKVIVKMRKERMIYPIY